MASFNDCLDEIAFLTRSSTRVCILQDLRHGPLDTHALRHRFDCDRTTLQRNLNALVTHGWVQQTNDTYRITQAGELLAAELSTCMETADTALTLKPFLLWMPADEFDLDVELLADADITVSESNHPHGAISQHVDVLQRAARFRGFLPSVGRHSLETIWRRVTNGEGTFEVVVPEEGLDVLQSESAYAEMFNEILESGRVDVLVYEGDIPYYLGISEDVVQLGGEDANGMWRALLETDREAVRDWAEETYEEYTQQASALDRGSLTAPELMS